MRNFFRGLLLMWPLLIAVATHAAGGPDGDTKRWTTHRVAIGTKVVEFTIPPRESKDLPPFEIPARIDTEREDVFDEALMGPELLDRGWDYRESRLLHVDGTLSAYIGLRRSDRPLVDMHALQDAVRESSRLFAAKKYLASGSHGRSDNPVDFLPARIAGHDAWKVSYEMSQPDYVVALDAAHYLEIAVRYGGVSDPKYRADAKAAAKAILESIRIEDAGPMNMRQ